jgi:dihydroneopterin aldolase
MQDVILLEGIEVPAALGVSKAERQMRRPVQIEIELCLDLGRAGRGDRVAETVDYADIYRTVEGVAATREHRLVEALAERISAALLARYPIESCTVCVRKQAPVAGNLKRAGVRITRSRGE